MKKAQRGATIVEFALVLLVFLMFFLGVLDMARLLFTWTAANEAARSGARFAAVCATGSGDETKTLQKMQGLLPQITDIYVTFEKEDGTSCSSGGCNRVRVGISTLQFTWVSPLPGLGSLLTKMAPPMEATFTSETMGSDSNNASICL